LLLREIAALDDLDDEAQRQAKRAVLEAHARQLGMKCFNFDIVEEPIPDPLIDAVPWRDRTRLAEITQRMHDNPASQLAALEELAKRYPHIPMIRNHLAGALDAAGHHERAETMITETVRLFPDYLFGICNHVMLLLVAGKIDEARAILEDGPSGPRLFLGDVCPGRPTFHVSEVVAFCGMVGQYFLSTQRIDAARVQLQMLRSVAPDHPQTKNLAKRMNEVASMNVVLGAIEKIVKSPPRKTATRQKRKRT